MDYCEGHVSLVERVAKAETTLELLCKQQAALFTKIDVLTDSITQIIKGTWTRGTVAMIVAMSNALVVLTAILVTHYLNNGTT